MSMSISQQIEQKAPSEPLSPVSESNITIQMQDEQMISFNETPYLICTVPMQLNEPLNSIGEQLAEHFNNNLKQIDANSVEFRKLEAFNQVEQKISNNYQQLIEMNLDFKGKQFTSIQNFQPMQKFNKQQISDIWRTGRFQAMENQTETTWQLGKYLVQGVEKRKRCFLNMLSMPFRQIYQYKKRIKTTKVDSFGRVISAPCITLALLRIYEFFPNLISLIIGLPRFHSDLTNYILKQMFEDQRQRQCFEQLTKEAQDQYRNFTILVVNYVKFEKY